MCYLYFCSTDLPLNSSILHWYCSGKKKLFGYFWNSQGLALDTVPQHFIFCNTFLLTARKSGRVQTNKHCLFSYLKPNYYHEFQLDSNGLKTNWIRMIPITFESEELLNWKPYWFIVAPDTFKTGKYWNCCFNQKW